MKKMSDQVISRTVLPPTSSSRPVFRVTSVPKSLSIAPPVRLSRPHSQQSQDKKKPASSSVASSKTSKRPLSSSSSSTSSSSCRSRPSKKRSLSSGQRVTTVSPPLSYVTAPKPPTKTPSSSSSGKPKTAKSNRKSNESLRTSATSSVSGRGASQPQTNVTSGVTTRGGSQPQSSIISGVTTRGGSSTSRHVSTPSPRASPRSSPRGNNNQYRENGHCNGIGSGGGKSMSKAVPARRTNSTSEMKPKLSTRSVTRSKTEEGCADVDIESFWKIHNKEHWGPLTEEHLEHIQTLLKEQQAGVNEMKLDEVRHPYHCDPLDMTVPVPVEVVDTASIPSSFSHHLAQRGSVDEIFWENVHQRSIRDEVNTTTIGGADGVPIQHTDASVCPNIEVTKTSKGLSNKVMPTAANYLSTSTIPCSSLCCGVLGKRGRLYDDLWDESDFVGKKSALIKICNKSTALIPFRSKVVASWGEILNNYSDDHDGLYIDWVLDKLLCERRENSYKKEGERKKTKMSLFPPPVPISCQHPASWGLHARTTKPHEVPRDFHLGLESTPPKKRGNREFDVAELHPASLTDDTVLPAAYNLSTNKSKNPATFFPIKVNPPRSDIDDMDIYVNMLMTQLTRQREKNIALLTQLSRTVRSEMHLQSLRSQLSKLENTTLQVAEYFRKSEKSLRNVSTAARLRRVGILSQDKASENRNQAEHSGERRDVPDVECKRAQRGQQKSVRIFERGKFSGNLQLDNMIKYFKEKDFLHSLRVGDLVEMCGIGNVWSLGKVEDVKSDTNGTAHFVQLRAMGSFCGDLQWLPLADNLITRPGVHIPQFVVDAALR